MKQKNVIVIVVKNKIGKTLKHNTRIAPSPTGDMHLGTARTAYFNWLAARASGGKFILRIDDTDKDRSDDTFTKVIIETMDWLGLDYDELVYQSDRLDRYKQVASYLVDIKDAEVLENGAIALTADSIPDTWQDTIAGVLAVSGTAKKQSTNLILMKGDGMPTYHFASVVDDMDFGINHIIRGHDHISNTPKQITIMNALGAEIPLFTHVGLIHHAKKKLSKRDKAASMLYYRDKGYDPDAMLNFLLSLCWGPKNEGKEHKIIDRQFALDLFLNGGNMRNQSANADFNKLESYDRKYKAKKGIWRTKQILIND